MTTAMQRPPLVRSSDRMIAGVCSGLADHLGWPVKYIRLGMVLASFAGGAGLAFYAWLWVMVPTADESARRNSRRPASPIAPSVSMPSEVITPDGGAQPLPLSAPVPVLASWFRLRRIQYGKEILLGAGLLLVAAILIARQFGVDVPLGTLIPAAAILGGAAIAWMQLDETRRAGLVDKTKADQAGGWVRLAAGLALVVAGVLVMVSGSGSWEQTWLALLASIAVLGGVALVLLPWGLKFWKDLETERAARVRETERAEIAAHLHDSVLQTLALIQRRAGSEQDVVRLARAQERELRSWLYRDAAKDAGLLAERIAAAAAEVEDAHGHAVDVVSVGDAIMTDRHEALVLAAREAMHNAARHGGGAVSVYLESSETGSEVFVRDRGPGFDPDAVPEDRLGVKESIIGRMKRHGGTVVINSSSEGTEVRLKLPVENADKAETRNGEAKG
ncbi:ATP-binding protein [Arthrobacter bambusae]|uniref:ATP-binding protein n=1 Tax=Arthrobacter bambusae TaxID=1338426 RepID=UPI0027887882|nr:ATP-binding protein [Arthrobacter bambusae]MDQ0030948.1 signal transduction histidine kinase/phage shock protein PspC (stress-responsive transcriptional regulator) [Arthrobacter bambusae]MDQ0098919.1 signal transduction histidine kinase/phage shock protein PspC (stress-responsive transcriptional regulator) [Arthrobacter bambusae]